MTSEHTALSGKFVRKDATPGGELGGTYETPTVDATHSSSPHSALPDQTADIVLQFGEKLRSYDSDTVTKRDNIYNDGTYTVVGNAADPIQLWSAGGRPIEYDNVGAYSLLSTKYLRHVVKQADEVVNNSVTLQNDDELVVAVLANKVYHVRCVLRFTQPATGIIKAAFTVPTGASFNGSRGSQSQYAYAETDMTVLGSLETLAGAGTYVAVLDGILLTGANAGNLRLQWAQNVAEVADTTVHAGSILEVWS